MLPGKVYKPEDILQILVRRIWLLLVPFAVIAAGTAVYTRYLPDRFRSDTLISVAPQRVPESYVRSTVTTRVEERLQAISLQILSRSRLERIIQEFNLYPAERQNGIMEDIVQRMRDADIRVSVQGADSFRVSYEGENPRIVKNVAERLASHFIEENVRERSAQAESTSQFLDGALENARQRLVDAEKKLETYRKQHAGQLPSQLESNTQALSSAQSEINRISESLNRDTALRLQFEQRLEELEDSVVPDAALGIRQVQSEAARLLAAAKSELEAAEARLTEDHPNLRILRRKVQELQERVDAEAGENPVSDPGTSTRTLAINRLREQMNLLDRETRDKQEQLKRLRAQAGAYLTRVEGVPTRESEMAELTRDYAIVQARSNRLAQNREEAMLSANVEQRQIGEQFRLLEPARIPERPFSPDRQRMNMMGMAAGVGLGLLLIAFLEYRDKSFKTDEEVSQLLTLPVLAVVPLLQSVEEKKRAFRLNLAMHVGCGAMVMVCLAVVTYTFVR